MRRNPCERRGRSMVRKPVGSLPDKGAYAGVEIVTGNRHQGWRLGGCLHGWSDGQTGRSVSRPVPQPGLILPAAGRAGQWPFLEMLCVESAVYNFERPAIFFFQLH
jgi:hypothetical protein